MTLAAGSRLGPYEVLSPLGAGGMGEVYRARDTRLGREVAVKVLPAGFAADPERLARFDREARSASALSHAHVVAVFDVGRSGESFYIVTEIVEGGNLRGLLDRGPMPLRRALDLSVQIVSGLAEAHESGVVHRDLKPENILLTKSGEAKIADFGLAKLAETGSAGMSQLPTSDGLKTSDGIVMGTVAYMSPEQAGGREVDFRSDQFAFGSILYEMLAGRSPFRRSTAGETMAAVLRDEPQPVRAINSSVPPQLGWILDRCLAKEPDARYGSTRDLARELALVREHLSEMTSGSLPAGAPPLMPGGRGRIARWLLMGGALGVLAGAAIAALLSGRRAAPAAPTVRFALAPPPGNTFLPSAETADLAVSPDGQSIAFVATGGGALQIWIRALSESVARPVGGTQGARSVFWSPDGRSLAFFAGDRLKRVEIPGGTAVTICDVPPGLGFAGSWGSSGDILYADVQGDAIYGVAASGGAPRVVLRSEASRGEFRVVWPWFLPDGRSFLYIAYLSTGKEIRSELMLAQPERAPRPIAAMRSRVEYVDPGFLVFARDGALLAQRFDAERGALIGAPIPVAPHVRYFLSTAWAGFSASRNGTLVYESQQNVSHLIWLDRGGGRMGELGSPADYLDDLRFSRDGERVLSARARPDLGTYDLWMFDLARGTETRLTSDVESEFGGVWLPDGSGIIYSAARAAPPQLVRRNLSTGADSVLLPDRRFQVASDVSNDGRLLAFIARSARGNYGAYLLPLAGEPKPRTLLDPVFSTDAVRFSPDGRFVSFASNESGTWQAYVAPVDAMARRMPISPAAASWPRWSRDGKEIFFLAGGNRLESVPVRTEPSLDIGKPTTLFTLPPETRWTDFEPSPDGKRFLAVVPEIDTFAQPADVIVNWKPEVSK